MSQLAVLIIILAATALATALGLFSRWFFARAGRYQLHLARVEQIEALRQAAIPFEERSVAPNQEPTILIKTRHLEAVCQILSSYVVTSFPTERRRIHEVVLRPVITTRLPYRVETTGIAEEAREIVTKLVSEIIVPAVRTNVHVYQPDQRPQTPKSDNDFHVFLNYCATGRFHKAPEQIAGIKTGEGCSVYLPTGAGIPLIDNGFTYAEIIGNSLYLLCPFGTFTEKPHIALLTRLLEKAAPEVGVDALIEEVLSEAPAEEAVALNRRLTVFSQDFDERREKIVKALVKHTLTPVVRNHIHVQALDQDSQVPLTDELFHIFHNATPAGPSRMPSGIGMPVTDDNGLLLGEIIDNNLYIYENVLKLGTRKDAQALLKTLLAAREEFESEHSAQPDQIHRSRFVEACLKQIEVATKATKATNDSSGNLALQLQEADQRLNTLIAQSRQAEQELFRTETEPESVLGKEFDSLFNIAKVLDVKVTSEAVVVETDTIFCRDPRSKLLHQLGAFEIHLPLAGTAIKILNKDGPVHLGESHYMTAPHVNASGYPCLGNYQDVFAELLQERQFAAAVQMAIAFLESVNVSDPWGRNINRFPIASEPVEPTARRQK